MDTLDGIPDSGGGFPFTSAKLAATRNDVPCELGLLPFEDGAHFTRSIWVVYISEWTTWTHVIIPVDNRLDMPDPDMITSLCGLVANAITRWHSHIEDEEALVVLRRPGPRGVSDADWHIFRLVREAAAGRDTAPWSFHIATPGGARELMPNGEIWPDVPSPR
jgi:hypothetical protein